ncbi:MAG: DUF2284 domain-containing protein [Clostridia bacterium]|nr:DUF2284 domain-containing protein [Clostridia bacterium]
MNFKEILDEALAGKAWQSACIPTSEITFSKAVVEACEANYCGKYNATWTCPPAVGKLDELRKKYSSYRYAYVFTTKHEIEDCFDIEGMFSAKKDHEKTEEELMPLLKGKECEMLGAGGCSVCEKCTYPDEACRFPNRARPSIEACGVDVTDLARKCGINYINGENTVTYFSVVFFNGL